MLLFSTKLWFKDLKTQLTGWIPLIGWVNPLEPRESWLLLLPTANAVSFPRPPYLERRGRTSVSSNQSTQLSLCFMPVFPWTYLFATPMFKNKKIKTRKCLNLQHAASGNSLADRFRQRPERSSLHPRKQVCKGKDRMVVGPETGSSQH